MVFFFPTDQGHESCWIAKNHIFVQLHSNARIREAWHEFCLLIKETTAFSLVSHRLEPRHIISSILRSGPPSIPTRYATPYLKEDFTVSKKHVFFFFLVPLTLILVLKSEILLFPQREKNETGVLLRPKGKHTQQALTVPPHT